MYMWESKSILSEFFFSIQRFVLIRYSTAFLTFRIPHIYGTFRYLPWRRELVSFFKVVHSFLSRSNSIEHFMLSHTRSNETSIPSLFEQRMGSEERENSNWKGNTTEMSVVCLMEKSIQFSLSVRFDRIAHSLVTFELRWSFFFPSFSSFELLRSAVFVYKFRCCCYGFCLNGQSTYEAVIQLYLVCNE